MDPVEHEANEEQAVETFSDHLHSVEPFETNGIDGEPSIVPRVGDQYQVNLPPLATDLESFQQRRNTDDMFGFDNYTGTGLHIPIVWFHHADSHMTCAQEKFQDTKAGGTAAGSANSTNSKMVGDKFRMTSGCPHDMSNNDDRVPHCTACNAEIPNDLSDQNKLEQHTSQEYTKAFGCPMSMDFSNLQVKKAEGYSALPCPPDAPWTDVEAQNFLLALYFFGKNFVQVRKFIGNKEQGDILSYYYGKFYRSDAHHRWTECRKTRSRKAVFGQRILTGWRQQELVSRLMPMMSTDAQNGFQEATKMFNEGRASLEEYVHRLKAAVGLQVLVEAIGIGTGKKDLTSMAFEPGRKNFRPEIPIGKECSSLTSGEIIDCLSADIRLSKARSNDLFWEAVWPRLLARGWHSEQPKNLSHLVFLVPGIKKFSRKKLERNNHYFDSVRDVLNQVAADPRIIELEDEGALGRSNIKDGYGLDMDARLDKKGLPDRTHSYLRPRLPSCISELEKFTVVDTSLVQGDAPFKICELRSLPMNITSCYVPSTPSGKTGSDHSEEQQNSPDTQLNDRQDPSPSLYSDKRFQDSKVYMFGNEMQFDRTDNMATATVSERSLPVDRQVCDDEYLDMLSSKGPAKDTKHQRKRKPSQSDRLVPTASRQKLNSTSNGGTQHLTGTRPRSHKLKKEESYIELDSYEINDIVGVDVVPYQGMVPTHSSATNRSTAVETAVSREKHQPRVMIDLNLPVLPESDAVEPFCMVTSGSCHVLAQVEPVYTADTRRLLADSQVLGASNGVLSDQHPSTNTRRHGTRSRPPTAKALEALASGLMGTKRKGRDSDIHPSNTSKRRHRRVHRAAVKPPIPAAFVSEVTEPNVHPVFTSDVNEPNVQPVFCSDMREPNAQMTAWYIADGNNETMLSGSRVESERNRIHELLGVP